MHPITTAQAEAAYQILVQEAGANADEDDRRSFVSFVATGPRQTTEYRFVGALGFGGKFRNLEYMPYPYVDCYPENETPARLVIIEKTNARLAELFAAPVCEEGPATPTPR